MEKIKITSLIIPALNEEGCIGKTIVEIPRNFIDEIIVIDGHSTDNTINEAKEVLGPNDRVIIQKRKGWGAALREAFELASGEIVIVMDADGSQNPKDITSLLERLDSETKFAMASRYKAGGKSEDDTLIRGFGNWLFTKLTNLIHGTGVTDVLYFFFAIHRKNIAKLNLQSAGYEICIELMVKVKQAGLQIEEVPVTERPRLQGESKVNAFWDGLRILRAILHKY